MHAECFTRQCWVRDVHRGSAGGRAWLCKKLGLEPRAYAGQSRYLDFSLLFSVEALKISIDHRELRLWNDWETEKIRFAT